MTLDEQLEQATRRRKIQEATRLLAQGANPNAKHGELFRIAISWQDVVLVQEFLKHGAKITPASLRDSVENDLDRWQVTEILLNHGADPNSVAPSIGLNDLGEPDSPGVFFTPLMVAARIGNLPAAKLLLKYGAKLNARLPDGRTALTLAAQESHLDLCKFFFDHKADFQGAQEELLRVCIQNSDAAFFDRLKKLGALPRPLKWPHFGVLTLPMAQRMLAEGADPNGNHNGAIEDMPPLAAATFSKDWPLAQFLLKHGANIESASLTDTVPERFVSPAQIKIHSDAFERYQAEHPAPTPKTSMNSTMIRLMTTIMSILNPPKKWAKI